MLEIKNNLELAQHLEKFAVEQRPAEYRKFCMIAGFKVKSLGYLMKTYAAWKERHGSPDTQN